MATVSGEGSHVLTLDEQRAAEELLRTAAAEGRLDDGELGHRVGLVYKATTRHELYKATGGLTGDPHRGDWGVWLKVAVILVVLVAFAIGAMAILGWWV